MLNGQRAATMVMGNWTPVTTNYVPTYHLESLRQADSDIFQRNPPPTSKPLDTCLVPACGCCPGKILLVSEYATIFDGDRRSKSSCRWALSFCLWMPGIWRLHLKQTLDVKTNSKTMANNIMLGLLNHVPRATSKIMKYKHKLQVKRIKFGRRGN